MTDPSATKASRAIGAMFFSILGGAWLVLGCIETVGLSLSFLLSIVAGSAVLFAAALRQFHQNKKAHAAEADLPATKRAGRIFNIVNAAQWIAIFVVANVLSNLGHKEWIIPSAIFIIGAHFLPLAAVLNVPRHYLTGGAMIALAVPYPLMSSSGPASPIGSLGTGIILWVSAAAALIPAFNLNPTTSA